MAGSLAALTDQKLTSDGYLDSFDVIGAMLGDKDAKGRDHLVQQDNGNNGTLALRSGKWKLHRYGKNFARNVVVEKKLANTKVPKLQLFDLENDPAEKKNVIDQHPEVAERLKKQLDEIVQSGRSRS